MSDFLRAEFSLPAPPPPSRRGGWALVRENLFGDARSSAITPAQVSFAGAAGPSVNDVASENAPASCSESTVR